MARKVIDVWPVLSVTPEQPGRCWTKDDALAAYREVNDAIQRLQTPSRYRLNIGFNFEEDARCEHCNSVWTEAGTLYNGGCCDRDQANDPDRLGVLRALAEEVENGDFHTLDEGRPSRTAISWPDTLASAVLAWLDADRPAEKAPALLPLAKRVNGEEWCTIWSDPGPSSASLARLPDSVSRDSRPEELAEEVIRLIDDMGLTPAARAA